MSDPVDLTAEQGEFEASAQAYLRHLREAHPEHFMESTAQAQQRKVFVASFDLVTAENPSIHAYNELLVQWRGNGGRVIRKVVPDNMVVVSGRAPTPAGSYDLPLQPAPPFWVLEYVSKNSRRKDYEDNFDKYEQELEVPYYLIFYPETQDLTLYRHNGRRYISVKPNRQDRHAIPEIEIESGLLDGWARFWFRGRLLPLPSDLQRQLDEARRENANLKRRAELAEQKLADALAEIARLRGPQGG